MTNQELELESALVMARLLQRTLYVPMLGKHPDLVSGYAHLRSHDLFPADRIFDFPRMSLYCRVIPLNIPISEHLKRFHPNTVRKVKTTVGFPGETMSQKLSSAREQLLYFSGEGMWHHWFDRITM